MKRVCIDKLLSETHPDEEMISENTLKMFKNISDKKTKRIIDSGLKKIRAAESGIQISENENYIAVKPKRKRIFIRVAVSACLIVFTASIPVIVKMNSNKIIPGLDSSVKTKISESDKPGSDTYWEEILPDGIKVFEKCPGYNLTDIYCAGNSIFAFASKSLNNSYIRTYDPETGEKSYIDFSEYLYNANGNIEDFYISDDNYLYFCGRILTDDPIKYTGITGKYNIKAQKPETINYTDNKSFKKIIRLNNSDYFYLLDGHNIDIMDEQLTITESKPLLEPALQFALDNSAIENASDYMLDQIACDKSDNLYVLLEKKSEPGEPVNPETYFIVKFDSGLNPSFVIPNSELKKVYGEHGTLDLSNISNGRTGLYGYKNHIGIIDESKPEISEIYDIPECNYQLYIDSNDTCDMVLYSDSEMQFWNTGEDKPAKTYKRIEENDYMFATDITETDIYHGLTQIHNGIFYYQPPDYSSQSAIYEISLSENTREKYYTDISNCAVNKSGDIYEAPFYPIYSGDNCNKVRNIAKFNSGLAEKISDEKIYYDIMAVSADENILFTYFNYITENEVYSLYSQEGRKLYDFQLPEEFKGNVLSIKSTASGEKIFLTENETGRIWCYEPEKNTLSEMSTLNEMITNPEENQFFNVKANGGKYDFCISENADDYQRFYGYNADTGEITFLFENTEELDFSDFTVAEDDTIYCLSEQTDTIYSISTP